MYFFVAVLLWLVVLFAIWYYKKLVLWLLFSPDYLLIIGAVGTFTVDHMWWLTSTRQAHYIWATLAMMAAGFGYHALNRWLYLRSAHTYKIVSFPFVVASSLVIMLGLVLKIADEIAPRLADNPTVQHIIYIAIGIVLAIVAWLKRQSTMARLFPPEPSLVINGDVTINGSEVTAQVPEPPRNHPGGDTGAASY
ncbi:hypothetical protein [Schaalia odontolytica]|uniref:Uncharacterized protein n=1 Tax=Schaalia odontolytica TaxID=1660 RepID=A0A2X0VQ41_9ACTO|nr:hypothetical protein [Schaalia odontolytica]WMS28105.1 hypothetical protein RDV55_03495 [Schaalia odontolytica]SPT56042.1 Uncharacterised protein [Schaalia odontolytica]